MNKRSFDTEGSPPEKKIPVVYRLDVNDASGVLSEVPVRLVNTTPHSVRFYDKQGENVVMEVEASPEHSLRLGAPPQQPLDAVWGIPVLSPPAYDRVEGVVPHTTDVALLVSMAVGEYMRAHPETVPVYGQQVYGPDTGPANSVRSPSGEILGTRALIRYV